MSIYTKTGDYGMTSLFGGSRVNKFDLKIETYGTIDELTSMIGFTKICIKNPSDNELLTEIQKDLYSIMAHLAGSPNPSIEYLQKRVLEFEHIIDSIDKKLPVLKSFVIPQGNELSTRLHLSRTLCRRAERRLVELLSDNSKNNTFDKHNRVILQSYFNRLSDLLFMLSRKYGKDKPVIKR